MKSFIKQVLVIAMVGAWAVNPAAAQLSKLKEKVKGKSGEALVSSVPAGVDKLDKFLIKATETQENTPRPMLGFTGSTFLSKQVVYFNVLDRKDMAAKLGVPFFGTVYRSFQLSNDQECPEDSRVFSPEENTYIFYKGKSDDKKPGKTIPKRMGYLVFYPYDKQMPEVMLVLAPDADALAKWQGEEGKKAIKDLEAKIWEVAGDMEKEIEKEFIAKYAKEVESYRDNNSFMENSIEKPGKLHSEEVLKQIRETLQGWANNAFGGNTEMIAVSLVGNDYVIYRNNLTGVVTGRGIQGKMAFIEPSLKEHGLFMYYPFDAVQNHDGKNFSGGWTAVGTSSTVSRVWKEKIASFQK
ncbi:hypothetical protein [Rhodoflexus caldus]|uniref:hypothetical protein n=1 Tax=Rhodoflexus caldus TaxID=2891236 RepID=UPI00202A7939|nr:hypothetical protein [Rhodoflexus caldus]